MIYYNPLDKFYKTETGAVLENKDIIFRVKGNFNSVIFVCQKDNENEVHYKMTKIESYFEINISFSIGLYFYYFICDGQFLSKSYDYVGELSQNINPFQLTAFSKNYVVPNWIYGGIIYQIFPDRFFRAKKEKIVPDYKVLHENWSDFPVFMPNEQGEIINNDFFGGDLLGIEEKLDYIKSLGVNAIYLNPIFKSFSNHRYDTGDYMQIDEMLGDEKDLISLINNANIKGIKIIFDGVFNHTGDDSLYFNRYNRYESIGAYQDKSSKYYSWYNFKDYPNDYESWWGIKTLPSVNHTNNDYINFITGINGVIERYTKLGVCGWRLDVVDELNDEFVKKIREAVKRNNAEAIVIGEVWEDASNKISYGKRREYFQGEELDSVMNYPLKNAIISFIQNGDSASLSHIIKEQIDHYPQKVLHALMNILSTHDTARILSTVGGERYNNKSKQELAKLKISNDAIDMAIFNLKVASLLQFTLCGVPSIYYGDEIGLQGYFDPLNRCTYPWGHEDDRILSWYKFLSKVRQSYSAFETGNFEEIYKGQGVYVFKRSDDNSEILIAINISNQFIIIDFDNELKELITSKKCFNTYELKEKSIAIFINE